MIFIFMIFMISMVSMIFLISMLVSACVPVLASCCHQPSAALCPPMMDVAADQADGGAVSTLEPH